MLVRMENRPPFDEFAFTIRMGLSKALRARTLRDLAGKDRQASERALEHVAAVVAAHVRLANWQIGRRPPLAGSAGPVRPRPADDGEF